MGSSSQGGSSLDDLMLAYTDLSAPAAKGPGGHGFKGPPVKDIRREAPSKVFQHSTKARDWRTLDQSLESAFSAGPVLNLAAPTIPFTAQPQLLGGGGSGSGISPVQNQNKSNDIDEWGEFQDFSAAPPSNCNTMPSISHPPPPANTHTSQTVGCRLASFQDESPVHRFKNQTSVPAPHNIPVKIPNFSAPPLFQVQPKSQPSSIIDLDDEFGDFAVPTTRSFTSLTSSNISSTKSFSATFPIDKPIQPMQKQQNTFPIDLPISISNTFPIDKPVSVEKTFGIEQPVPVSMSSNPAVFPSITPKPVSVSPLTPMTSNPSSTDKYSALRMFLDQPEEPNLLVSAPIETNAAITNVSVLNRPDDSNDTDFGDFVEVSSTSTLPNGEKNLPSSDLSDIFNQPNGSTDFNSTPDFLNAPQTSANSFPFQPHSASPGPIKLPLTVPIQFTSPQPRNLPTLLPSPTTHNEEQNLDEWSLPATTEIESDNVRPSINLFKPPPKPTSIPYLCSSPPPDLAVSSILSSSPPLMSSPGSQLNVEEFSLPSEQFGFSDQEIFGIKSTKTKTKVDQPQSFQDILSLSKKSSKQDSDNLKPAVEESEDIQTVDPQSISLDNSRHGSPASLRVSSKSPESQSVASLEFESHNDPTKQCSDKKSDLDSLESKGTINSPPLSKYNGFVTEETQPTSSPSKEWCILLTEILTLIESTRDTFDNIISEDLKEEVITSEQGKNFLLNLVEVHKVYSRVASSHKQRLLMEVEEEKVGLEQVGQFCDEIDRDWKRLREHCNSYGALSKPDDPADEGEGVCGICLGGGGSLVYGGGVYHPGCANYWVNCVRDSLPCLS